MRLAMLGVVAMSIASNQSYAANDPPLNVAEWKSASEIIHGAKDLIIKDGWQQGSTVSIASNCMATALERSWSNSKKSIVDFIYAQAAVNHTISAPSLQQLSNGNDPLSVPYWGRYMMYWNDSPVRTMDEVIMTMDSAEAYASNQSDAAMKAHKTEADLDKFDHDMKVQLKLLDK